MAFLKNIRQQWLLYSILALAVFIRFFPINQYQFSHDELSGLSRTIYPGLMDEINYGIKIDAHPALIQLFLWFWVKLFSYNEIAIKLPFLMCGVLSVWYIYRFGKTFLSEAAGLISAAILACSFIIVVYSSYSRMYISGVLFCILVLHAVFRIAFSEETPTKKDYLLFALFALLCAYNHHMSSLFALTVSLLALCYIPKSRLKPYLIASLCTVLLYLPHLPITMYQLSVGGIGFASGGWLSEPRYNELYFFVKTLLGCGISGKVMMVVFFGLFIISVFKLIPITRKQFFLLWIFLINYGIIHLYSIWRNPILQFSVLLFSAVSLILFLSSFAAFLKPTQLKLLCLAVIAALCFQTFYKKHFFSKVNIHNYEMQAVTYLKMERIAGKGHVAAVFNSEKFFTYLYQKKYGHPIKSLSNQDSTFIKPELFRSYLAHLKQPYIVVSGLSPQYIQLVKERYPHLVSNQEDYFSNISVFSKYNFGYYDVSQLNTMPLLNSDINIYLEPDKPITFIKDSINFKIEQGDKEYTFNLSIPVRRALAKQNQYLMAELDFMTDSAHLSGKDELCLAIAGGGKPSVYYKSVPLKAFYDPSRKVQKAYLDLFIGTEFDNWWKKDMNYGFFIHHADSSAYTITNFKLKLVDYNPTTWTLWN